MTGRTLQRCCRVPGCGPLPANSSSFAWTARMCDFHQAAEAVEMPAAVGGGLWRFCRPCVLMHPLECFHGSQRACWRYADTAEQHRRTDEWPMRAQQDPLPRPAKRLDHDGDDSLSGPNCNETPAAKDGPLWGQRVVAAMAGQTIYSKLSIPIVYFDAVHRLGWQEPLTWVALGTAAAGLHLLVPHLYEKHYVRPLAALRKRAGKAKLILSSALTICNNHEQKRLFEKMATQRSTYGWVKDTLMFVTLLCVHSTQTIVLLLANGWGVRSFAPVAVSSLALAPVRAHAMVKGEYTRRQWVDMAADLYCNAAQYLPLLLDSFPVPSVLHGSSELTVAAMGVCVCSVLGLAKMMVLEKPLRCSIASDVAVGAFIVTVVSPVTLAKIAEVGGAPTSAYDRVPYISTVAFSMMSLLCVTHRAKSEVGHLNSFLSRRPEKFQGHAVRPHLAMHAKLTRATPDNLPWDLREQMIRLAETEVESLEGHIRPGCVLLTLSYRFADSGGMEAGLDAILRNLRQPAVMAGLPWAHTDGVITVGDTRFTVEGGAIVKEEAVLAPMIISVDPLVLFDAQTATLTVMGLGTALFSVMLRLGSEYLELEVVSCEEAPNDHDTRKVTQVTVRLPEFPMPGMAWIEIQSHASSSCPIISDGFPLLFTWKQSLADELSSSLQDKLPTVQHVGSFLQDVAMCLSEETVLTDRDSPVAPARLLQEVAQLGLPICFSCISLRLEALEAADRLPGGLLSAAIESGSSETLAMVKHILQLYDLPVDPCRIEPDSPGGFSPLHLAARQGSTDMIALLMEGLPAPELPWSTLQSGLCGRTPAELMMAHQPWFSVQDVIRKLRSFQGQAVWGTGLVKALSLQTTASRVAFPAAYSAMLWAMGWREPVAWVVVAVLCYTLHRLAPSIHRQYVDCLQRARDTAKSCGLQVSQGLHLLDREMRRSYEQYALLERASRYPVNSSLLFTVVLLPGALLPVIDSWKMQGTVEPWTLAQAAVAVPALTALRLWACKTDMLGFRQWVDLAAYNYFIMMVGCFNIYMWASGSDNCVVRDVYYETAGKPLAFVFFVLLPMMVAFYTGKMLLVSGPLAWAAWPEPLLSLAEVYMLGSVVDPWCFKLRSGQDSHRLIGPAAVVFLLMGNMFYLRTRVQAEAVLLRRFLATMQHKG